MAPISAERINQLTRLDAGGLPVSSLYATCGVGKSAMRAFSSRISNLVSEIRPAAEDDSAGHEAKLSVRGDIERIEEAAGRERAKPGTVAFFSCSGRDFFEEIDLPRPTRDRAVVDATPLVRPLLAVLDEYHRTCVGVIDKKTTRLWELYLEQMQEVKTVRGRSLRKPDYAGWHGYEEHRVSNKAEEFTRRHFRHTGGVLDEVFREGDFELLVVGGHDEEVPSFLDALPKRLRSRLAGTFTVDPHGASEPEIREQADAVVERYERDEEKRLVEETLGAAAAGGLAATGLDDCLWAGSVAAIGLLLVADGAVEPGVVCDRDGWLGRSGKACPLCGNPVRETPDVIDELAERVIDTSGSIEHVQADTDLDQHLVAASLRFPLPPHP